MKNALFLTCGRSEDAFSRIPRLPGRADRITRADIYSLDTQRLEEFGALLISMHADQRFLSARANRLNRFLESGGTITVNGQIAYPFLAGLARFQPLRDRRAQELTVRREAAHPVWEGVAEEELTFRRGVAGFYGRGWHQPPEGATVIHSIGADRHPLDFVYQVGSGRVLFHGGNDLWQYAGANDTTSRIVPQLLDWLFAKELAA